jgi:hypothetical protein
MPSVSTPVAPALAVVPAAVIWLLALAGLAAIATAFWGMSHPEIIAKGQDPAGKGMATGCFGLMFFLLVTVLGVVDVVFAWGFGGDASWLTRLVSTLPLLAVAIVVIVSLVQWQVQAARSERAEWEEKLKIPVLVIVELDDARLSRMFEALQSAFPQVQQQLFPAPSALEDQFNEWLPRAKLICIQADLVPPPGKAEFWGDSKMLAEALTRYRPPACPILLHATDAAAMDSIAGTIRGAGWDVHTLVVGGDDAQWIHAVWLPKAVQLVSRSLHSLPKVISSH